MECASAFGRIFCVEYFHIICCHIKFYLSFGAKNTNYRGILQIIGIGIS